VPFNGQYKLREREQGNTRRIKAFTVGIEALGKSSSFDPQTDPSVRVLAKRLRSSLDAYYENNPNTFIYIEMKPGSYIPKFLIRSEMNSAPAENVAPALHQAENAASSINAAHVNVPQTENTQQSATETEDAQAANMRNMWQAYTTTSKVAWIGLAITCGKPACKGRSLISMEHGAAKFAWSY